VFRLLASAAARTSATLASTSALSTVAARILLRLSCSSIRDTAETRTLLDNRTIRWRHLWTSGAGERSGSAGTRSSGNRRRHDRHRSSWKTSLDVGSGHGLRSEEPG
jgi:hypothetical protein